jgi:lipopolysaccharide-induced tumor necrosis factor-alpha factor
MNPNQVEEGQSYRQMNTEPNNQPQQNVYPEVQYGQQPNYQPGYAQSPPPQNFQQQQPNYNPNVQQVHVIPANLGQPVMIVQMGQAYIINGIDYNFCRHCNRGTNSRIYVVPGLGTWLICLGLAIIGLILCCWIPFCIDDMKDKTFVCTECGRIKAEKKLIS